MDIKTKVIAINSIESVIGTRKKIYVIHNIIIRSILLIRYSLFTDFLIGMSLFCMSTSG